jgi:hypothetical protein
MDLHSRFYRNYHIREEFLAAVVWSGSERCGWVSVWCPVDRFPLPQIVHCFNFCKKPLRVRYIMAFKTDMMTKLGKDGQSCNPLFRRDGSHTPCGKKALPVGSISSSVPLCNTPSFIKPLTAISMARRCKSRYMTPGFTILMHVSCISSTML